VPTMGAGVILFLTLLATTEALFTPEEIQAILNQQNTFRRLVNPSAANMQELKWDVELAAVAQVLLAPLSSTNPR